MSMPTEKNLGRQLLELERENQKLQAKLARTELDRRCRIRDLKAKIKRLERALQSSEGKRNHIIFQGTRQQSGGPPMSSPGSPRNSVGTR